MASHGVPARSLTKMTTAEFSAALKTRGFRIVDAKIEDATCRWYRSDHGRTLAKVIRERDADCTTGRGVGRAAGVKMTPQPLRAIARRSVREREDVSSATSLRRYLRSFAIRRSTKWRMVPTIAWPL
jgi:hypothetical protein